MLKRIGRSIGLIPACSCRQVAAYAGRAASHWQSGKVDHDQGVSNMGGDYQPLKLGQLGSARYTI